MDRRTFLKQTAGALIAIEAVHPLPWNRMRADRSSRPQMRAGRLPMTVRWRSFKECESSAYYPKPVLMKAVPITRLSGEGGPHEGLVYSSVRRDVARNNQNGFLSIAAEDGEIPHAMKDIEIGWRHLQLAVPLVATAWELSQKTAIASFSKQRTTVGAAGMLDPQVSKHPRYGAWWKDSAPTIPVRITVLDGRHSRKLPGWRRPEVFHRYPHCRACVRTCRQMCTEDAWPWRPWRRRSARVRRQIDGPRARNRCVR